MHSREARSGTPSQSVGPSRIQDPSFVKRAAHRRWGGQHSRHAPRRRRSMQHRRRVQRESFVKQERGNSATPTHGTTVGAAAICTGIAAPAVGVCSLWGNGLFGR